MIEELFHISQCQEEGFIIPRGPLSLPIVSTRVGIEINIFSFNCNKHIAIQSSIYTQKKAESELKEMIQKVGLIDDDDVDEWVVKGAKETAMRIY